MSNRLSNTVRRKFLEYFSSKHGHSFVRSSPVLPRDDNSLSFTNAGMNQFKHLFLADADNYRQRRICNYQKCIRVGGKTCDLDKIGRDFRHHTFFEMLGNWSFNDYGKPEACEWALDFLVNHMDIKMDKLYMTYFSSQQEEDLETREIWRSLGVEPERILANINGDNFWEMGASGPCGLSTEIFYSNGDSLLEIWNLVFIDRHRLPESGKLITLKNKFVDTGLGLERILSVLEGVDSNYETDVFRSLFDVIKAKSNVGAYKGSLTDPLDINYRILADHSRMITVALTDGVVPGRRGASFDLRSIIKKSLLISRDIFGQEIPRLLLFDLVDENINILSEAYPELKTSTKLIRRTLAKESKRYLSYLERANESHDPS